MPMRRPRSDSYEAEPGGSPKRSQAVQFVTEESTRLGVGNECTWRQT